MTKAEKFKKSYPPELSNGLYDGWVNNNGNCALRLCGKETTMVPTDAIKLAHWILDTFEKEEE